MERFNPKILSIPFVLLISGCIEFVDAPVAQHGTHNSQPRRLEMICISADGEHSIDVPTSKSIPYSIDHFIRSHIDQLQKIHPLQEQLLNPNNDNIFAITYIRQSRSTPNYSTYEVTFQTCPHLLEKTYISGKAKANLNNELTRISNFLRNKNLSPENDFVLDDSSGINPTFTLQIRIPIREKAVTI